MKKLIHKILCIKVSRVIRFWNDPENSIAVQSVALRAQRLELPTEGVNLLAEIRMEAIQAALKQH